MWQQEAVYCELGKRKMFCVPGMGETWEEEARKRGWAGYLRLGVV